MTLFALSSLVGMWLMRYIEVYPSGYGTSVTSAPFGIWEIGCLLLYAGAWGWCYTMFMDAFPRMRVTLITSPLSRRSAGAGESRDDGAVARARVGA